MYSNLFVCLFGMGTVFFGLVCIILLCMLMSRICMAIESGQTQQAAASATAASVPAAATDPVRPQELEVAVLAVLAEELGVSIGRIRIVSLKKI